MVVSSDYLPKINILQVFFNQNIIELGRLSHNISWDEHKMT